MKIIAPLLASYSNIIDYHRAFLFIIIIRLIYIEQAVSFLNNVFVVCCCSFYYMALKKKTYFFITYFVNYIRG